MERTVQNSADEQHPGSVSVSSSTKKGGWVTFPFMIATITGISLAFGGLVSNLIVYLIQEFNIKSIRAAKIYNVFNGFATILPVAFAIIADSFLGCYSVIWFSSLISSLGLLLIVLTAAFNKLRPPHCETGSNLCSDPSHVQLAVLYIGLALAALGMAGTRFTVGPMGAYQLDKPKHQTIFFNWYIFAMYISTAISSTVILYVEESVSWAWGFGICLAANIFGLAIFLAGSGLYRRLKPEGSPFVVLARVIVAAIKKRHMKLSLKPEDYCQGPDAADSKEDKDIIPSKFFRFLNRAALKAEGDIKADYSIRPWRLCKVQDVEDLKGLIKILPLWSTGFFLSTPLVMQTSLTVLQALVMDRHFGSTKVSIPAGSIWVSSLISTCITVFLLDRFLYPLWDKYTRRPIKPLQRVGIGHVIDIISMAALALVEAKRLKIVRQHHLQDQDNAIVPMSAFWLVVPFAIAGIGEAFFFPAQVAFYFQEFPTSLKSTSTAFVALYMGIAYYISNGVIDLVRRTTGWLPDDINKGRLDNVYWLVCILASINFCYFLVCASLYKYRDPEKDTDDISD
ncbi:OLC1v1004034C1 [Oldenlandia corymbosa var. corymbosa]|uniref:OLC1v1004034C1 n=1 Tax=Oldenlandia corymbosa var. corymbosa TaxID=529605 RepID=A0AAV1DBB3_OLDCO|nr:OLC1v1004034C1 [Oldenlandia corymbosa var. corymbosa]